MTNNGWVAVGEIARKRRERLGLNQDELALFGGPKVATVGKFERAAQENFPLRTQHQIEQALGWGRGIVEQVVESINDGRLRVEDWEYDLVEEGIPDMSSRLAGVPDAQPEDVLDAGLLAFKAVLALVPEDSREAAIQAAVRALFPYAERPEGAGPNLHAVAFEGDIEPPGEFD